MGFKKGLVRYEKKCISIWQLYVKDTEEKLCRKDLKEYVKIK